MPANEFSKKDLGTAVHPTNAITDERVLALEIHRRKDIDVGYHRFYSGELDVPPMTGHVIAVHLGNPVKTLQRRDGRVYEGVYAKGDVEIIPAGCESWWQFDNEDEGISIAFEHSFMQQVAAQSAEMNPDGIEIISTFRTCDALIAQIGLALFSELNDQGLGGPLLIESASNMLAVHLLRSYSSRKPTIRQYKGGLSRSKLKCAIEFINENLNTDLALTEIAEVVGMSPFYFARLFKQSTSLTPHQYVIGRRIERAKELLAKTDLQIVEIAHKVGFANQSHFARYFRKLMFITPKKYRNNL